MSEKRERTIVELYMDDPEQAEATIFGRRTDVSRRGFLNGAGLAAMSAAVGGTIVHSATMPGGLIPAAFAQDAKKAPAAAASKGPQPFSFPGKDPGLSLLGERPLVAETPEHLLDDETTPFSKFFIRNNGQIPDPATQPDSWELTIDGEVNSPLKLNLGEMKKRFATKSLYAVLECGGNGRSFYVPQARGNQWTNGGAGCAKWTGVSLAEVVKAAAPKASAVYTAHYGTDQHLSGDSKQLTLSRGVRLPKAMEPEAMLVWAMNDAPLDNIHGGPLRLLIPGWPGSASHKWLNKITLRDKEHDGPGMTNFSYRVPINPMVPGGKGDPKNFKILESMPVRGIITNPPNGAKLAAGTREIALRGAAWAGDDTVKALHVSTDYGATWQQAEVGKPRNKFDWQRWTANIKLPSDGYYEIWARATDSKDRMQPHAAPNWNPQGYGGNPLHRVAILVG
jgi:sulfite oxidase